jgi:phosphatidylserine/phosphatidylglycerophosphate/cardiolipin synthase-like enzyme
MKQFMQLFSCGFLLATGACGSAPAKTRATPPVAPEASGAANSAPPPVQAPVQDPPGQSPPPAQPPPSATGLTTTVLPDPNAVSDIEADIAAATQSISLGMYLFDNDTLANALVAAKQRGVDVRVVIDNSSNTASYNQWDMKLLTDANIPVVDASGFTYYHAKYAIFDDSYALVMTCNWSLASFTANREVIVRVDDAATVAELTTIFDADFTQTTPTLPATSALVVSPVNSRTALTALIEGATSEVWIGIEELDDATMVGTLTALAGKGVSVNVILPTVAAMSANQASAATLAAGGVTVRALATLYPHEKVIVTDSAAYVGSVNLSYTSLGKNREIGIIGSGAFHDAMLAELQSDWAQAAAY